MTLKIYNYKFLLKVNRIISDIKLFSSETSNFIIQFNYDTAIHYKILDKNNFVRSF